MNEFTRRQVDFYLETLGEIIGQQGSYHAQLTVFGTAPDGPSVIMPMVIPPEFMESDHGKDYFVNRVLPGIARYAKSKMAISAVVWGSEIWMRTVPITEADKVKNYKEIPISGEAVLVIVDHDGPPENYLFNIHRTGKKITRDGELIDEIQLTKDKEWRGPGKGKFSGLYKLFQEA